MAHQDYVARTRKPKNKSPYKGKEDTCSIRYANVKIKIFAIVTVIAISWFWFYPLETESS